MTLVWNDDNMKRKGRKIPLSASHLSHHTLQFSKQRSSTGKHHFTSTPSLLISVAYNCQWQSIKMQDAEDYIFTLFMSRLKAGLAAKFPATVHFSSGAYLGLDSGKTAQGKPPVHPSFQGHLHHLLCSASCKAAACCLGPLHTHGLRDIQELT